MGQKLDLLQPFYKGVTLDTLLVCTEVSYYRWGGGVLHNMELKFWGPNLSFEPDFLCFPLNTFAG